MVQKGKPVAKDRTLDLVLWRHAEAIDLELVGDDMLRTLTPRGEKQAHGWTVNCRRAPKCFLAPHCVRIKRRKRWSVSTKLTRA